jgi:hypothetical protein
MTCQYPEITSQNPLVFREVVCKTGKDNLSIEPLNMAEQKTKQTRRGVELYKSNPFLPSITIKSRKITNKRGNMMLVNADTGEIQAPIAGFWEAKEVDTASFVKLFVNGVKAFAELSSSGTKVFEIFYLEMHENIGKDRVYLSYTAIDENTNKIGESTFRRGLAELISKKFIAPTIVVGWYWINPDFLWNGDRIAFVKEYYKKDSDRQANEERSKSLASTTEP